MKTMTIREFLAMDLDMDCYNNVTDEEGVAFVGPITLTAEGEKEFKEVLDWKIEVDIDDDYAVVICDDEETHFSWKHKKRKSMELFWVLAGYCSYDDYNKWVKEDE